jgi:hypothetical protein
MNLDLRTLTPAQAAKFSELVSSKGTGSGARVLRPFIQYDYQSYAAAGSTGLTFFNTSGAQKDLSDALTVRCSNQVQAGIMDEPLLVTHISVDFITTVGVPATDVIDIVKFYQSGRLAISINDKEVYELAPLGKAGSSYGTAGFVGGTNGTPIANAYAINRPLKLDLPVLIDEQLRFKVTMNWTTVVAVTTAARVGVNLHGIKSFKA